MTLVEVIGLKGASANAAVLIVGDRLFATYLGYHTQMLSLQTGGETGELVGVAAAVSPDGKLAATLDSSAHVLTVYDLDSMTERTRFSFPHTIAAVQFNAAGNQVLTITNDEMVYRFRVPQPQEIASHAILAGPTSLF